jgi:hypothetical protein
LSPTGSSVLDAGADAGAVAGDGGEEQQGGGGEPFHGGRRVWIALACVACVAAGFGLAFPLSALLRREPAPTAGKDQEAGQDGKSRPKAPERPPLKSWPQVGNKANLGDVVVTVPYAIAGPVWGPLKNIAPPEGPARLYVKIRIENRSRTRQVQWNGFAWHRHGEVSDEHGNTYRPLRFSDQELWMCPPNTPDREPDPEVQMGDMISYDEVIHPGQKYAGFLFFEVPVAVAQEARLTVPADAFEGMQGELKFRVPITRLK